MTPRKRWSIAGMIIGGALLPSALCGLLGTAVGTMQSFDAVAASETPSPSALADGVRFAAYWTAPGLTMSVAGLAVLVASLILFFSEPRRSRRPGA